MSERDTIHALASGSPPAGIAVLRVSGPRADRVLATLADGPPPAPRRAALRTLRDGRGGVIDRALVLRFEAGASFTGEPVVELHLHGGPALVRAAMAAIAEAGPSRLAEPGEFTLRAFEQGRIDLAEVEALGDLIAAETAAQHAQAAKLVAGRLHARVESWRTRLIEAAALVEVTIDWADEEVPEDTSPDVAAILAGLAREIAEELEAAEGAEKLRTGLEIAILGAPNAGKSSLLNALAGREAAIVTEVPGTTRDVVELRYDLAGLPVRFLDTAGLRETEDPVERIGVARALDRAVAADLRIFLAAPDAGPTEGMAALVRPGDLRVDSKADLGRPADGVLPDDLPRVGISVARGEGLEALLAAIGEALAPRAQGGLVAHERQRIALASGLAAIEAARKGLDRAGAEEVSEDIRTATRALERLTGRIGVEDMLGAVFSRFCLGK